MKYVRIIKEINFVIGMSERESEVVFEVLQNHRKIMKLGMAKPRELEMMGHKIVRWYLTCYATDEADFQALVNEFEERKLRISVTIR